MVLTVVGLFMAKLPANIWRHGLQCLRNLAPIAGVILRRLIQRVGSQSDGDRSPVKPAANVQALVAGNHDKRLFLRKICTG